MNDGLTARWEYDCGHCQLNWNCGPICACFSGYKPNPKRRWYSIWFPGHKGVKNSIADGRHGPFAEVNTNKATTGKTIMFRLVGKPWQKGVVTGQRKYGAIAVRI